MSLSDPQPYPRLTAEQKEHMLREVVLYLATMERYRLAQRHSVAPQGEQLKLFPAERLDV
jgi:hypothetical protein